MRKPTSSLNLLPIHIEITSTSSPPCHGWGFSVSLACLRPCPCTRGGHPFISHLETWAHQFPIQISRHQENGAVRPSVRQLLDYPSSLLLQLDSPSSVLRVSPIIPPLQLSPNILFIIFYYLPPKNSSPYNSFSPTIPPISIPSIYYHSLTNYLFIIFEFKKTYSICTVIIRIIIILRGSNEINIVKKRCD